MLRSSSPSPGFSKFWRFMELVPVKPKLLAQQLSLQMRPIWKNAGIWEPRSYVCWSNILIPTHQYPSLVQECEEPGTSLSVLLQAVISGCLLSFTPLYGSLPLIPGPSIFPWAQAVSTVDTVTGHRAGPGPLSLARWSNGSWSAWTLGFFCELKSAKGATALTRCPSPGLQGAWTSQWKLLPLEPLSPTGQKAARLGSLHLCEETSL